MSKQIGTTALAFNIVLQWALKAPRRSFYAALSLAAMSGRTLDTQLVCYMLSLNNQVNFLSHYVITVLTRWTFSIALRQPSIKAWCAFRHKFMMFMNTSKIDFQYQPVYREMMHIVNAESPFRSFYVRQNGKIRNKYLREFGCYLHMKDERVGWWEKLFNNLTTLSVELLFMLRLSNEVFHVMFILVSFTHREKKWWFAYFLLTITEQALGKYTHKSAVSSTFSSLRLFSDFFSRSSHPVS